MRHHFTGKGDKVQAIIFPVDPVTKKPRKYSHVTNSVRCIQTFCSFVKRVMPGAEYINFYTRPSATKKGFFIERIYIS